MYVRTVFRKTAKNNYDGVENFNIVENLNSGGQIYYHAVANSVEYLLLPLLSFVFNVPIFGVEIVEVIINALYIVTLSHLNVFLQLRKIENLCSSIKKEEEEN